MPRKAKYRIKARKTKDKRGTRLTFRSQASKKYPQLGDRVDIVSFRKGKKPLLMADPDFTMGFTLGRLGIRKK